MKKELKELFGVLAGAFIFGELLLNTVFKQAQAITQPQQVAPSISLSPTSTSPGGQVSVTGSGFSPSGIVNINFIDPNGILKTGVGNAVADSNGRFTKTVQIPSTANRGTGYIEAIDFKTFASAKAPITITSAAAIGLGAPTPTPIIQPSTTPSPIIQPTAQPQPVSLAETQSKIEQMIKQGATSEALQTYLQTVGKLVTGEVTAPVGTGIGVAFPAGTPEAQTLAQLAQKEQTLVSQGLTVSGAQTVVYGGRPVTLYRVYSKDGVLIAKFDTTQSNWQQVLAAYQQSVNQFGGRIEATTFS